MGHHHSKPRVQQRAMLSSLENDPSDLPPTYTEASMDNSPPRDHLLATPASSSNEILELLRELRFRDTTIRDLEDKLARKNSGHGDKIPSKSKTKGLTPEAKLDEKLLAVKDRERELLQTLNQVRSGKRYTELVIGSLEQQVRNLKKEIRQKTQGTELLEEQVEETKKLVEDKNSQTNILPARAFDAEFKTDCEKCKDLEQQLQAIKSTSTAEREDLTTEMSARGCLIDFDNRYIETLYQRLRTCRIASMRVPPHLDTEEKKVQCLKEACNGLSKPFSEQGFSDRSNESQEQQELTHLSTAAAIEHRRQIVGLHVQEAYTDLRLTRDELKGRIDNPSLEDDDDHAIVEHEFDIIVRLFIDCHKLIDCYQLGKQHRQFRTEEAPEIMNTSSAVDAAGSGKDC